VCCTSAIESGLIWCVVAVLIAPTLGSAQSVQLFESVPLRVNVGDQLQIQDESGAKVTGRATRLTRDEIVLETSAGEKHFPRGGVEGVSLPAHALRRGALVVTGLFAVFGGITTCSHEGGRACGIVGPLRAAPIGASLGVALGALIPQIKPVYRRPEETVSVEGGIGAGRAEFSLLEELGAWVNLDDRLHIEERSGLKRTGRLTGLTETGMTIQTDAGDKQFTREALRQVSVARHSSAPVRVPRLAESQRALRETGLSARMPCSSEAGLAPAPALLWECFSIAQGRLSGTTAGAAAHLSRGAGHSAGRRDRSNRLLVAVLGTCFASPSTTKRSTASRVRPFCALYDKSRSKFRRSATTIAWSQPENADHVWSAWRSTRDSHPLVRQRSRMAWSSRRIPPNSSRIDDR
jgi:hypothetical protein